ncbi:MAG: hypothetical protein ACI4MK_02195 [Aristaeellaceae bacterium]
MADMSMDRIRDEMGKEQPGSPIEAIGEYVTERLNQGAAVPEGKTLAGAYKAIEDWAREHKGGKSCVCVPPQMAFSIVDRYFGFGEEPQTFAAPKPVKKAEPDGLDLDALLEGL